MKIYIAGKITGLPLEECSKKFNKQESILQAQGHSTVNPMTIVPSDSSWHDAMEICLKALYECDAVFMLKDWRDSKGARLEHLTAKNRKLKIIYEGTEWS